MKILDAFRPATSRWAHGAVIAALAASCAVVIARTVPELALLPPDLERRFVLGPLNLIFSGYALLLAVVVTWRTGSRREGRHLALMLGYVAACMALSVVPRGAAEGWRQAAFGLLWMGAIVEGLKFFTAFPRPVTPEGVSALLARSNRRGLLAALDRFVARLVRILVATLWGKAAFTAAALGFAYRLVGEGSHRYNMLSGFLRPSGLLMPVEVLLDVAGGVVILTVAAMAWTGFRMADEEDRRRVLWIVLAQVTVAAFTLASLSLSLLQGLTDSHTIGVVRRFFAAVYHPFIWFVDLSGFALAIFHSGAFDLRPVINRTTLYGGLFLTLTFLFAAVEELAQSLVTERLGVPDGLGAWLGAGSIAAAMGPIRERLERLLKGMNRALQQELE